MFRRLVALFLAVALALGSAAFGFSSPAQAASTPGTPYAWGSNEYGQLGDGTTISRLTPVQVSGLTGVTAIAAGYWYSLALKSDGTVWACRSLEVEGCRSSTGCLQSGPRSRTCGGKHHIQALS